MVLSCKTMIDEGDNEIIINDFGHSDQFTSGIFGGSSEVDVRLPQTRIELENVVDGTLVTIGHFINKHSLFFKK